MQPEYAEFVRRLEVSGVLAKLLEEDVGHGDVTSESTIPPTSNGLGSFLAKDGGILAGCAVTERLFRLTDADAEVQWLYADGNEMAQGAVIGSVRARTRALLMAERLALNILQRMSGIATATRRMVHAAAPFRVLIRDTRKTVPGLRLLDKWAVRIGGGENHRMDLYDRILIKDNHIAAAGGIRAALQAARRHVHSTGKVVGIDVEARTLEEVSAALATGGFDVLLLDNMARTDVDGNLDASMLHSAVQLVAGQFRTEASGNVTLETVAQIAATGVDFISVGSLTHSVKALDISFEIEAL